MHVLDNVYLWDVFRKWLDIVFGMYRKRFERIREFGIDSSQTILDIGCGTGQYSQLTKSEYFGIDMDPRYIVRARVKYGSANKRFECLKLQDFASSGKRYDASLVIDVTHHISDADLRSLFAHLVPLTKRFVVIADPIRQQPRNLIGRFLTSIDRGKFIREKAEELRLIEEFFRIQKVAQFSIWGVDTLLVFACPKEL